MQLRGDFWLNIIVLYGSPHTSGSTASLLGAFMSGFSCYTAGCGAADREAACRRACHNIPHEVCTVTFSAYDMDIRPCLDCGMCVPEDTCRFGDLDRFDSALRRCGGIVIASPVYHSSFPAPLKALFDRTQRYYNACRRKQPVFPGAPRPAAVLLAAGQASETGDIIKKQLSRILPPLGASISEFVIAPGTDRSPPGASVLSEAEEAGIRFLASVS